MRSETRLVKAQDVRVGDRVVFLTARYDYTVERVETTKIGMIRHHHSNETASSSYWPDELLYVGNC
jgi:hypothetical protein